MDPPFPSYLKYCTGGLRPGMVSRLNLAMLLGSASEIRSEYTGLWKYK